MKKSIISGILAVSTWSAATAQYSWNTVGQGTNFTVQSLATDTNNHILYAGGLFSMAGGAPALNIAKWDGATYSPLGGGILSGTSVNSMLVMPNGDLVAGGSFTNIGGIVTKNIAVWNGLAWSALGAGLDTSSSAIIKALAIYNNELYAGGIFSNSGGTPLNYIAKWSGSSWVPVGGGMNGVVSSLCVYNGELYAGGTFTTAGGVPVNNIAKWNGTTWSDVGGGCSYTGTISVSTLQVYTGGLYAGGTFTTAGTTAVKHIARWDGVNWNDVGGGASNYTGTISISTFQVFHNELIAGGTFDSLGGLQAKYIGKWNGVSWSPLGTGMNNTVYTLAAMPDTLYAGGLFTNAGGVTALFVAQWQPNATFVTHEQGSVSEGVLFNLFPNPSSGSITIQSRDAVHTGAGFSFVLTDAYGRIVSRKDLVKGNLVVERGGLAKGIYFYKIVRNNQERNISQEGKIIFAD